MFGFGNSSRRSRGGAFSTSNLTKAALAGAGLLAARWWRNRQNEERRAPRREDEPTINTESARTF